MTLTSDLILYVLVRVDLPSMGYGKGAAQACHAANLFTYQHAIIPFMAGRQPDDDVMGWTDQANGFGTTFTLASPSLDALVNAVETAQILGFKAGTVVDPTYPFLVSNEIAGRLDKSNLTRESIPMRDNMTLCFSEEITTGYIFGSKSDLAVILSKFEALSND